MVKFRFGLTKLCVGHLWRLFVSTCTVTTQEKTFCTGKMQQKMHFKKCTLPICTPDLSHITLTPNDRI